MSLSVQTHPNRSLAETARRICESRGGKWSGTKGMACCPAHDDRTPSLGVSLGRQATRVAALLASGRHLTRTDISGLFAEETGVLDWGGAWTIDDYNSAVEIGALLWLRESSRIDLATNVHEAEARFDWLEAALPPRHVRSEAQVELQQFSTPPMLAWLMAKAAAVCAQDTLLEPSAGNGALALWGCLQNASLLLNEIDPARRGGLVHIFPAATITAHDGELIADLHRGTVPSVVLMNPPFAHSHERGKDGETAMRHLRGAIRAAANGARIIAIMPDGFDASTFAKAQDEASLLLNVRLEQMFRRTGTGIAVRLVVIDKVPTASSSTIIGATCDLIALGELVTELPPRAKTSAGLHCLPVGKLARLVCKPSTQRTPVRPVAPFAATPAAKANAVNLAYSVLADPAPVPEQAGIYLPYRPSRIAFEDAPVHPTPLVESVAMGSVAAPQPDVCPRLPAGWQADGLLSEAQCETLVYAALAFARDLPGRFKVSQEGTSLELSEDGHAYRQGFFLGDGTGAGKGRQIAAVIMDRWLAGERRHVWITKNEALLEDARRDWEALGGLPLDIQPLSRWKLGGLTDNLPTIQRWLNRILALPIALQNAIFDEYLGLVEARIEAAREAGTLDQGLETVRVDHFTVLADELLRTDPVTGAETRLVSLEVTRHLRPLRLQRLVRMHEIGSRHAIPMRNMRSGKVALSVPARRLIADDGAVIERRRLLRPLKSANWTLEALAESHWEEIGVTAFTSTWRTEEEEAAKSPVTERVHLATGLLLPVWKRLPGDHVRVTRLVAEDGQSIIGREVLDVDLAAIADTFGLCGVTGPAAEQIGDLVLASGKPLVLASHDALTVKRSLVGGEQRLELTGFSPDRLDWYKNKGCFTEIIRYRTRLFVPVSKASSVLPALAA
ncbi:strawberry notch-like NTP hydrolase domain-containing protein [Qipengyuania sp. MTN3-11]|uniref:strawberry notch-like NTP hydrolase domain-containing protein n=1 Tax=Qipengyuania sp. MTN3-11 TaxID=3056557 RepID=UPI0036F22C0F